MKNIFLISIIFFALKAQASDTLTRAQVYNFNVGDTFDYRNYNDYYAGYGCGTDTPYSTVSVSYTRYLITNIFYSQDSSTKYIVREQVFPQLVFFDTLILQDLSGDEVFLDTSACFTAGHNLFGDTIIMYDTSQYNDRSVNMLGQLTCSGYYNVELLEFGDGLGLTLKVTGGAALGCSWEDSIELIYYHKGAETWGTSYYNFATGIKTINDDGGQVNLFPTVNDGTFNVAVTNASLLPINLLLYDITGREVKSITLNNINNNINIEPCSAGIYIWKAVTKDRLIKTGKMVLH